MSKLGLGTVQLGLPYGNRAHEPLMSDSQAREILALAVRSGIRFFDSAIAYGESERRLGDFNLSKQAPGIEIATKISKVAEEKWRDTENYRKFVVEAAKQSAKRLKIPHHNLLQFHQHELEFLHSPETAELFAALVESKICNQVGVSVYEPKEAWAALKIPAVSAIQIPVNLLDRRFLDPELIDECKNSEVRLIGRSIFLQGVLSEGTVPHSKKPLKELREKAAQLAEASGWTLPALALAFAVHHLKDVLDTVLIGVDSAKALEQNLQTISLTTNRAIAEKLDVAFHELGQSSESLLDPRTWQ